MDITPEMARTELKRRKMASSSNQFISPEMARAELERRKKINEPEEGLLSRAGRSLARLPKNIVAGGLDVADFLSSPVREGLNLGAKAIGSERQIPTLSGEVTKGIDTLTGGYTSPQTNAEKTEEAIIRGISSLPIGGALGNVAKGIKNAPALIEGGGKFLRGSNMLTPTNIATTGATTGAIQEALNVNPEDTVGAAISGAKTGLGVSSLPSIAGLITKKGRGNISTSLGGTLGKKLNINPEAVESFQKSGITPTLADVSKSDRLKMMSGQLEKLPGTGEPIQRTRELQKKQIYEGLRQGEKDLSRGEASEIVKRGAKQYQKKKGSEFEGMFSRVEKDLESLPDTDIGVENINKFFEPTFNKFKGESQIKRFKSSPAGKLYTEMYDEARMNGGKLPYNVMKDFLDEINDKITTHGQIGKVSQGKLKGFAKALVRDMETDLDPKMKSLGEESYKNWKEAKKFYAQYAEQDIPKLNELYKKDKKGATEAFVDLVTNQKKGAEKAKIVLNGLDHKDQIDLTDAIHKELGRTSDGTFSALKWVRGYKSLDPSAKKVLTSPLDSHSIKRLDSISNTLDHMKSTLNEANTSKTAYHAALGSIGTHGLNKASHLLYGNPFPIAKFAGGLMAGRVISDKMLTNPKFINWLDKSMKAKNMKQFNNIINNVPHVGEGRKLLQREVQAFQHEIKNYKPEKEKE